MAVPMAVSHADAIVMLGIVVVSVLSFYSTTNYCFRKGRVVGFVKIVVSQQDRPTLPMAVGLLSLQSIIEMALSWTSVSPPASIVGMLQWFLSSTSLLCITTYAIRLYSGIAKKHWGSMDLFSSRRYYQLENFLMAIFIVWWFLLPLGLFYPPCAHSVGFGVYYLLGAVIMSAVLLVLKLKPFAYVIEALKLRPAFVRIKVGRLFLVLILHLTLGGILCLVFAIATFGGFSAAFCQPSLLLLLLRLNFQLYFLESVELGNGMIFFCRGWLGHLEPSKRETTVASGKSSDLQKMSKQSLDEGQLHALSSSNPSIGP